ncbi:hypothetical protein [Faecalibacterium sp. An121]|uniref:hypothetical protein n=1 Tax=Faecalibacterium sp. An121 TaxID=1965550 RepID=UPI000B392FEF|nr:hypothetical protein [Faecalibacterium sp. An121]OUQ34079.1 hypothetical protein B5E66_12440 [Faecalibacterium sp. An121]
MKLKKIASLALAGIMAVSMLAGCKDGSSSSEPTQPENPVTSNAVTYANDALTGAQKELFSFKTNEELDVALKAVATDSTAFTSNMIANAYKKVTWTNDADETTLTGKLEGKFSGQRVDVGDFYAVPADKESQKAIYLYTMSGSLDEKAAVTAVVSAIAGHMNRTTYPASIPVSGSTKYDCTYSANISSVKVAAPDNANNTAWVIGVVITQTVAESVA